MNSPENRDIDEFRAAIHRVAFKTPKPKSRIVWANVIVENEGLALLLVPKTEINQSHSIFITAENVADRVFKSISSFRFNLETDDVKEAGEKLKMLGKWFQNTNFNWRFRAEE